MIVKKSKGYRIAFLVSFLFSIYSSAILFMHFQARYVNGFLLNDFRIIASLSSIWDDKTVSQISAIRGVKNVRVVKSEELMKRLESEDKELYFSIKSLSKNPVPDIVEIEVDDMYFGYAENIVKELSLVNGVEEIRYRPDELVAIMHTEFYMRFLMFVFSMSLSIIFLMILFSAFHSGFKGFISSVIESSKWFLNGVAAGAIGVIFVYIIVIPLKNLSVLWSWFEWYYTLCIIMCSGFIGWVFFQWKKD
ncbi:MAG: permease-like cell division protein FtsX [Elusimicrobiales bacterium]